MGNFTRQITKTYSFDGDQISIVFRRLKRHEALQLAPFFKEENGETVMTFKDQLEMSNAVCDLLPDVILFLDGLVIDGVNVNYQSGQESEGFEDFVSNAYFLPLHTELMTDILDSSFVKETDEKKSEGSHKNTSQDTEQTVLSISNSAV